MPSREGAIERATNERAGERVHESTSWQRVFHGGALPTAQRPSGIRSRTASGRSCHRNTRSALAGRIERRINEAGAIVSNDTGPGRGLKPRDLMSRDSATPSGSLYDPHMPQMRASARWMRFGPAVALALGLAVMTGAAQDTIMINGRNLQVPINHGLPDQQVGFTFCRLRYQNVRRARKSGWGDDYPQADYNFMVRLTELTRTPISRWNNGDPGFANVTPLDPDLFRCPYLRMQNAANYEFTPDEAVRMHDYLVKGGFLWIDDNWDPDFQYIRPNLIRILPGARIVDLPVDYPMFSNVYHIDPLPQIPSLGSWVRTGRDSEIGPAPVHYYGVFDDHDRLLVLVSMNSDVSDSWEREGDNKDYFRAYATKGYTLGVNVAVWIMSH
jgi:hypothetical protein